MMMGIAILALAFLENRQNRMTQVFRVFGRTAFFYYIVHFYLAHLITAVLFFYRGHSLDDAVKALQKIPFLFQSAGHKAEAASLRFQNPEVQLRGQPHV